MANTLDEQLNAFGVAQILVVLKQAPRPAVGAKPSVALASAIPVAASRVAAGAAQPVVMQLAKHFTVSETSSDMALALSAKAHKVTTAGTRWFARAKSSASATPAVR